MMMVIMLSISMVMILTANSSVFKCESCEATDVAKELTIASMLMRTHLA